MARHLASPTLSSTYSGERSQGLEIQSKWVDWRYTSICISPSLCHPLLIDCSLLIVRYVTVFHLMCSREGGNDPLVLSPRWILTYCLLSSLLLWRQPCAQLPLLLGQVRQWQSNQTPFAASCFSLSHVPVTGISHPDAQLLCNTFKLKFYCSLLEKESLSEWL